LKIVGRDLQYNLVQYSTTKASRRKITFTQRVSNFESSAIQDLREKILASRTQFVQEFEKYDKSVTGKVTVKEWCEVMEYVMRMDLPWRSLRSKLVKDDPGTDIMVLYHTMFDQYHLYHRYTGNGPTLTEMLYRNKDNLETIFRILDRDNSGNMCTKFQVDWTSTSSKTTLTKNFNLKWEERTERRTEGRMNGSTDQKT
ncbi:serine 2 threonine-protein phosphatase with ef-hands, partial [Mytilus galloprovincialis]